MTHGMDLQLTAILLLITGLSALLITFNGLIKLKAFGLNKGWKALLAMLITLSIMYVVTIIRSLSGNITPTFIILCSMMVLISLFSGVVIQAFFSNLVKIQTLAEQHKEVLSTDALTKLLNRESTIAALNESCSTKAGLTCILVNINQFSHINHSMGREFADRVLCYVGDRLKLAFINDATVGRISGDEFLIKLDSVSKHKIQCYITAIEAISNDNLLIDDFSVSCKLSVGYCTYPNEAENLDSLLEKCNIALKESKRLCCPVDYKECDYLNGEISTSEMQSILNDLKSGSLEVHYQPILEAQNLEINSVEALIRLPNGNGGYYSPSIFIPIIEMQNKVSLLTTAVINRVAKDIQKITKFTSIVNVHINLSSKDLLNVKLLELIEWHAHNTPEFKTMISFEITESTAFEMNSTSNNAIIRLTQLGYQISLDDFGTGYSSLSLLRELPIMQLKLDRIFVSNIIDSKVDYNIVKTIIQLAHALGYTVVAEGVETECIANLISMLGCDYMQGFLFSPALPLTDLLKINITDAIGSSESSLNYG